MNIPNTRPPFPTVIDSTARKDLVACMYKFSVLRIRKLKPIGINPHLHFGSCYARGLEVTRKAFYNNGKDIPTSILLGGLAILKEWGDYEPPNFGSAANKTLSGCCELHTDFFREYPLDADILKPKKGADGKGAIEFNFALPINVKHPETGEPILYAGKFDMLAEHQESGGNFVDDEKTTGSLGKQWAENWQLASQFTGYVWGAEQFGYKISGVSIRGASVLKKEIKHLVCMEQRDNWMVERWLTQLERDVKRAIAAWEEGYYDFNLDDACNSYGGCSLKGICTSKNPETWLKSDFEHDDWNPLAEVG